MMERLARLVSASTALRRRIWASLPFRIRIAEVFSRLASMGTDAFGKVMYGEFLNHNVSGLPDIHGKPALEVANGKKNITNRLPPGYGREFGRKCFLMLMGLARNPQVVEEIMADFAVKFLESGSKHLREGTTLREAENFVMRSLKNANIDRMRKKRELSDNLGDGEEGEARSLYDVTPTFDETTVEKLFDERMLPKVRQRLKTIHPSAEQYVKLIIDGHSDREILGDPEHGEPSLLDDPLTTTGKHLNEKNWGSYKVKIFDVLKKEFQDLQQHHAV